MPGKIPAQVGEKEFESQNQARKYYLGLTQSPWKQTDCATPAASS